MVIRNLIADDGPLDTPVSCVFSKKLAAAIKRKGNRTGSRAEVIRELLDLDRVQDLLREDEEHQEKFRRMHRRN